MRLTLCDTGTTTATMNIWNADNDISVDLSSPLQEAFKERYNPIGINIKYEQLEKLSSEFRL